MKQRYTLNHGRFGPYFVDEQEHFDLGLEDVLYILNNGKPDYVEVLPVVQPSKESET